MKKSKQLFLSVSTVLVVAALAAGCSKKTDDQIKADADKTTDTVKDAVQTGMQKTSDVATNVAAKVVDVSTNVAAHAHDMATNAMADVKAGAEKVADMTTNAVQGAKELIHGTNQ
jgi:hypothetical protein